MSKFWNNLNVSTQLMTLPDFKEQVKKELKLSKIKHFSKGSKIGNTLLSRIRLDRSDIDLHTLSYECLCHAKHELWLHYLIYCFLYSGVRQTLFNMVQHYIQNFNQLNKAMKYEVLVKGIQTDNPEYNSTNTTFLIAVHNFILRTKRFPIVPFKPPPRNKNPSLASLYCEI